MADETQALEEFLGQPKRGRLQRYGRWILLGVGLILAALTLSRCFTAPSGPSYVTAPVQRGTIDVVVTATGTLAPTNQIDIGSEISGTVVRVLVDVNDRVRRGDPLAEIDPARLRDAAVRSHAALTSAQATVAQAQASLQEAQAQLARLREVSALSGGRVPSRTEMSAQEAAVARAEANLQAARSNAVSAQAQISSDQTQLAKAVIRSPVDGVVLRRSVDPGQTVQATFNTPSLFIIAEDLTQLQLEVSIDEADIGRVRDGLAATFTVDAYPGETFPASIDRVSLGARNITGGSSAASTISGGVVSYLATLSLRNDDGRLRPGMTATAAIQAQRAENVLFVSGAALRFTPPRDATGAPRPGFSIRPPNAGQAPNVQERAIGEGSRQVVYALTADTALQPIEVVTGASNGRNAVISGEGLSEGLQLVTGIRAGVRGE